MARRSVVLLIAGVLALSVAPSAAASHATDITVTGATIGPGGSVSASGTIDCVAGHRWFVQTIFRQRAGETLSTALDEGNCSSDGREAFTTDLIFGNGPFAPGRVMVETTGQVCDESFVDCARAATESTELHARKGPTPPADPLNLSATLGPEGSASVSATVDCPPGGLWSHRSTLRQKAGTTFNTGYGMTFGRCPADGPGVLSTGGFFADGPFRPGPAVAEGQLLACEPGGGCVTTDYGPTELRIRGSVPAPSAGSNPITVTHATIGPGGSVSVSGTVDCTPGHQWVVEVVIRQTTGKTYNTTHDDINGYCSTDGPEPFTTDLTLGPRLFRPGTVAVTTTGLVCEVPGTDCPLAPRELTETQARKGPTLPPDPLDPSATLGPGGSASVSVTIDCPAGSHWTLTSGLRQKSGKTFISGGGSGSGHCSANGPERLTTDAFLGNAPFKPGEAVIGGRVFLCDPDPGCVKTEYGPAEVRMGR